LLVEGLDRGWQHSLSQLFLKSVLTTLFFAPRWVALKKFVRPGLLAGDEGQETWLLRNNRPEGGGG